MKASPAGHALGCFVTFPFPFSNFTWTDTSNLFIALNGSLYRETPSNRLFIWNIELLVDGYPNESFSRARYEYRDLDSYKSDLHPGTLEKDRFKGFGSTRTKSSKLKNNKRNLKP